MDPARRSSSEAPKKVGAEPESHAQHLEVDSKRELPERVRHVIDVADVHARDRDFQVVLYVAGDRIGFVFGLVEHDALRRGRGRVGVGRVVVVLGRLGLCCGVIVADRLGALETNVTMAMSSGIAL